MKFSYFLIPLIFVFEARLSFAGDFSRDFTTDVEVSIRDEATTETEFQALARAHGRIAFSDRVLENSDILVSEAMFETFHQRLIEAQAEWLKKGPSFAAIDRFLELIHQVDWPAKERDAFQTFLKRRAEAVSGSTSAEVTRGRTLTLALPEDVVLILVNGEPVARHALSTFILPNRPARVTLISNLYEPASVLLEGDEVDWPRFERRPWINSDCSTLTPTMGSLAKLKPIALGVGRCSLIAAGLKAANAEKKETNFGLVSGTVTPWPETPEAPHGNGSVLRRPWFWGVVGVIAIGAAIAIERNQNQTTVRPAHSDGW